MRNYAAFGFDISPYLDGWKSATGSFMHTLNHPHIQVLTWLAHMVAVRAGFIDHATVLPGDVKDNLAAGVRWPVYPEIARRLGLPKGDTVFRRGQGELDLATLVGRFYSFYQEFDRAVIGDALDAQLVENLEAALRM